MLYGGLMLVILLLQVVFAFIFVKNLDIPLILSGLLGIYLVLCAYSAIGLFMSTLTSYRIRGERVEYTGDTLPALNFVGGLWRDSIPVAYGEIAWWLSLSGRAKKNVYAGELICSEDVVYFGVVIGLFLTLSVLKKLRSTKRALFLVVAVGTLPGEWFVSLWESDT